MPVTPTHPTTRPAPPRSTTWVVWSLAAMVVTLLLPFPLSLAAGVAGLVVFTLGVVGLAQLRRGSGSVAVIMLIAATLLGIYSALQTVAPVLLYDQIMARNECLKGAITNVAKRTCEDQFDADRRARLAEFGVELPDEK